MGSTTIYERGHVVVVNVPFTGQGGAKRRPALVLSADAFHCALPDLIVCPISSQPRFYNRPGGGDHPLRHWKSLGLRYPSTARLSNLMAVEKRLIQRALAPLHADDLALIEQGLREVFGL
ncbi:MAG: type II toxin-antitoxin system PemK/MazF family toxin [Acidobacteriia bacterium]|nr:type II toxin-antitoxin system PemK/MazF family toxin [Terriglobia bacterium]